MPNLQEKHVQVTRTARYFQLGKISNSLKEVWFVCHGYGQLAQYFIDNFKILDNGMRLIVAPEGLSRFYLNGVHGRIGASWMTREDRLNEIKDYVLYLDKIYEDIFSKLDRASVKVSVLGFSQGSATVCRWLTLGSIAADRLILWAGLLPPEIIEEKKLNLLNEFNLNFVVGRKDEYANEEAFENQTKQLKDSDIAFSLLQFDGSHEMNPELLLKIAVNP